MDNIFNIDYQDQEVSDRITRLLAKTGDLTPIMQEIGEYELLVTDRRFELEVDPTGVPWQELQPKTLAAKRAKNQILKILQRTGMMRSRVNYQATSTSVTVGINDVKAPFHQFGTSRIPARPILGVSEADKTEIITMLDEYLQE